MYRATYHQLTSLFGHLKLSSGGRVVRNAESTTLKLFPLCGKTANSGFQISSIFVIAFRCGAGIS